MPERPCQGVTSSPRHRAWTLVLFVLGTLAVGYAGSLATRGALESWYPALDKPSWTPPDGVFGPVWLALYVLMAFAGWRVWTVRRGVPGVELDMRLYLVQLAANIAWPVLFFGLESPALALLDIVLLWALVVWMTVRFLAADRVAGMLLVPYLLWVMFVVALNLAIVVMN